MVNAAEQTSETLFVVEAEEVMGDDPEHFAVGRKTVVCCNDFEFLKSEIDQAVNDAVRDLVLRFEIIIESSLGDADGFKAARQPISSVSPSLQTT